MNLHEYYEKYGSRISQDSERLFVEEFLYPLLGAKIAQVEPQYPFLDRSGKQRRIDFAYHGPTSKVAFEVNGETYHAEGIIPDSQFDDNLYRQNEILRSGYKLVRFSYSQLRSPQWRPIVQATMRDLIADHAPELLTEYQLTPTELQNEVLDALQFYRATVGRNRGVVVLPTGTGKTVLSALDARRVGGRVLFLVHRLDILKQSVDAYKLVWPDMKAGHLHGELHEHEMDCDVLFASKDTLRQPEQLARFSRDYFSYIVVDEVHHGQSPSYREILQYFTPSFMLGMTATPDRNDRKDIFELFDYSKIHEVPLSEAIDRGFLVPYTYYGLTDNVDYSSIRLNGSRYNERDLERLLIIPERNEAIVRAYLEKGEGDKAIGFCVSIQHAERMAEVFRAHGISAAAIHSEATNRDELMSDFRENRLQVAFTVDLFNEGVDFPNVQVLLFLRPTESKTVFLQQLGRGLRLCFGKERVRVLDFIGNYRRANGVRKLLSRGQHVEELDENGHRSRKIVYEYSNGCEVIFDEAVEEILDRQDAEELGVTKEDLKEAYFELAERLGRKPSRTELDEQGKYKSAKYAQLFGSWVSFLRDVGEYTEASYHYPQGTHLGHILAILHVFGSGTQEGSQFDGEYIRLRGGLGDGRISTYRRQIKYKLLAAMELGIITDDRNYPTDDYELALTATGLELYSALRPLLNSIPLDVDRDEENIPTTRMREDEAFYNTALRNYIEQHEEAGQITRRVFLGMHAVQQMLAYLYHICRDYRVERSTIYEQFFQAPFVKRFCDREGIEETTIEASRRRCPFLINILDACGIVRAERSYVTINKLVLLPSLVRPHDSEEIAVSQARVHEVTRAWPSAPDQLSGENLSIVRELFGANFLEDSYPLKSLPLIEI